MADAERLAKSGGPASLTLLQRLKSAVGDGPRILELVREAERSHHEDLQTLAEVYGVAVDVYGHVQSAQDYSFRDLCVKRMRTLCRLNPSEAREFHNRLRTYSIGRADARMYEARAAMEERLGDAAKAVKMLHEGLRVGAQPAEVLQRVLQRLQPQAAVGSNGSLIAEVLSAPSAPAVASDPGAHGSETGPAVPTAGVAATSGLPPPLPVRGASSTSAPTTPSVTVPIPNSSDAVAASVTAAARGAASPATQLDRAPKSSMAVKALSTRQPRILGLGSPMRRLPEDEADGDEEDELLEGIGSCLGGGVIAANQESYTATAMSMMPLSPIKEMDSPAKASSAGSARGGECASATPKAVPRTGGHHAARYVQTPAAASVAAAASAAAASAAAAAAPTPPSPAHSNHETPCKLADVSIDSAAAENPRSGPSKSSKVVVVNGVPYTQIQTIGRGGSSKVYLVQNPAGDKFALKRVMTENAKQLEAFENEVILLQQLRDHPYVIQVEDAEVDRVRGRINIVMEAGDMDLGRFLQSEPRLNLAQIQHLWRQMLEAVQVIHQERIVHSDLKPGNFLLVDGRLKVIDFGIAKRISNDTTNISRDASVGTLSYMAPEAVKQGQLKLGRASDIWSLGIILYQMIYGQPPFAHLEPMQRLLRLSDPCLSIKFPSGHRLEGHSASTKVQFTEVLSRCLQRDPRKRPSLPELLAHPFLSSVTEVRRDAVQSTVGALMSIVLKTVSSSLQIEDLDISNADWQVLADEAACTPIAAMSGWMLQGAAADFTMVEEAIISWSRIAEPPCIAVGTQSPPASECLWDHLQIQQDGIQLQAAIIITHRHKVLLKMSRALGANTGMCLGRPISRRPPMESLRRTRQAAARLMADLFVLLMYRERDTHLLDSVQAELGLAAGSVRFVRDGRGKSALESDYRRFNANNRSGDVAGWLNENFPVANAALLPGDALRAEVIRGAEYVYWIWQRIDLHWVALPPPLGQFRIYGSSDVWIPQGMDSDGVNDRFALVPRRWGDTYFGIYESTLNGSLAKKMPLAKEMGANALGPEWLLGVNLRARDVPLARFDSVSAVRCSRNSQMHCAKPDARFKYYMEAADADHNARRLASLGWEWSLARQLVRNITLRPGWSQPPFGHLWDKPGTFGQCLYEPELRRLAM
ncbi:unnamed protein product [Polarella glacialis]|uniref:Protein kinase domain-containing protein n=1 Tax=Polarella glacialis TaxID=89957 RepID=A0A813HMN2_POLGL|nr:unnamed protein product [Polarella glacialis]